MNKINIKEIGNNIILCTQRWQHISITFVEHYLNDRLDFSNTYYINIKSSQCSSIQFKLLV